VSYGRFRRSFFAVAQKVGRWCGIAQYIHGLPHYVINANANTSANAIALDRVNIRYIMMQ
jgi:hypothetical protein